MAYTAELEAAERRLARMIDRRAADEESSARADKAERVRRDDLKCRDLTAEFQADYQAFGVSPPLPNADEWSAGYEKRLLKGLQRRLSPRHAYADDSMLNDLPAKAVANFSQLIRAEAAKEAASPCEANLPESVSDPRAMRETFDPNSGARKIEFMAKRSFIADMSPEPQRVLRFVGKDGQILFGPPMDRVRP